MTPEERAALVTQVNSGKLPVTQLDPDAQWDGSLDAVAQKALLGLQSGAFEQAGVIYGNPDGKYAYSLPVTQHARDNFALKTQLENGMKMAGIWHTHPGDDDFGQVFSPRDIQVAEQLKVPSYVLFLKDHSIRKYVPGQTPTQLIRTPGSLEQLKVAKGLGLSNPEPTKNVLAQSLALSTQPADQPGS